MKIERYVTGAVSTNTYLLIEDDKYLIIDPSGKAENIIKHINGKVLAILLTHGHFDHIKAVDDLYDMYQCPIYLNEGDNDLVDPISSKKTNAYFGMHGSISRPITNISEGHYEIGPFSFDVMETPGHTQGSIIYIFDDNIFTGDTLFKGSIGRTDLYGGNFSQLKQSLRVFNNFKHDYNIYPGHDEATTLERELKSNPYL